MLTHKGTKAIETHRLILRPFRMEDAEAMYRNWAGDDEVTKFLTWPTHSSVEVSRAVLSDWTSHYGNPEFYNWAIVPKELGEPIGSIAVVGQRKDIRQAAMGYCMGRAFWRRGIMAEALTALIGFLLDEVGFDRIEADHDPRNPASGRVMEKSGMKHEGIMRQAGKSNQGIIDINRWAILNSDRE